MMGKQVWMSFARGYPPGPDIVKPPYQATAISCKTELIPDLFQVLTLLDDWLTLVNLSMSRIWIK